MRLLTSWAGRLAARPTIVAALVLAALSPTAARATVAARIQLDVDATDVAHGVQHAHLTMPVHPGPLTLAYPKWVPGEHGPNGPITQLVDLHLTADGSPLAWWRDPLDAFAFHVEMPAGATRLEASFDYLSPPKAFGPGFGQSPNSTAHLLILLFSQLVLYPADDAADAVQVEARVRIPPGWTADDALLPTPATAEALSLPAVSLATLADSPMVAGDHVRTITVTPGAGGVRMSVAADGAKDLVVSDRLTDGLRRLVSESEALFGPGHFRRYAWLVSLSDALREDGTEHHESSDVRSGETLFTDPAQTIQWRLFPHELVHSWNGKYRRPSGLATVNFQQPMQDDMLWMYEGLTRYYGDVVLMARSGLATSEETRAYLAYVAAQMDQDRPGRMWRPLADTATATPAFGSAPAAGTAARRGSDYYNEMLLVWLEADMVIRKAASGASLDDFSASFFSGPERAPAVRPYDRAEVVQELRRIALLDWDRFLAARLDAVGPRAPLGGLEASGWTLAYDDTPNPFLETVDKVSGSANLSLSLGFWADADGGVQDVVPGSAAYVAGLAPGMKLREIDGVKWTAAAARRAILKAETAGRPIELVAAQGNLIRSLKIDYHKGLRFPHLRRDASKPDLLSQVLAPRSTANQVNAK